MTRQPIDPNKRKYWAQGPEFVTFFDTAVERDAWIAIVPTERVMKSADILRVTRRTRNRIPHCGGQGSTIVFLE